MNNIQPSSPKTPTAFSIEEIAKDFFTPKYLNDLAKIKNEKNGEAIKHFSTPQALAFLLKSINDKANVIEAFSQSIKEASPKQKIDKAHISPLLDTLAQEHKATIKAHEIAVVQKSFLFCLENPLYIEQMNKTSQQSSQQPTPKTTSKVKLLNQKTFVESLQKHPYLLVDVWVPDCPPCQGIVHIINKIAATYENVVTIAKINAEEHPEIKKEYDIKYFPTLLFFKAGKEEARLVGGQSSIVIEEKLNQLFGLTKVCTVQGNCKIIKQ